MSIDKIIGATIRKERRRLDLSMQEVAAAIGKSPQQVQKYEVGKDRVSVSTLIAMEKGCGISASYVIFKAQGA